MAMILEARGSSERFVLHCRLGRGGSGEVWRARRESLLLDDDVCVKRPMTSLSPSERRAFVEEARILGRVRHSNVVSLLAAHVDPADRPFLVLEWVRGVDLRHLMNAAAARGHRVEASIAASVGAAICRALGAAGRAISGGVVHRDVSPHNVLVSTEGDVKLADFGVARAFDRGAWTRRGTVKGKTAYLSPEQLAGGVLDARSDLFALGVVIYELLSGQRPFAGDDPATLMQRILAAEHRPLGPLAPAAPASLVDTVEQLLRRRRVERPENADEALRLFAPHCDGELGAVGLRRLVDGLHRPGLRRIRPRPEAVVSASEILHDTESTHRIPRA